MWQGKKRRGKHSQIPSGDTKPSQNQGYNMERSASDSGYHPCPHKSSKGRNKK